MGKEVGELALNSLAIDSHLIEAVAGAADVVPRILDGVAQSSSLSVNSRSGRRYYGSRNPPNESDLRISSWTSRNR